jgi:hypothetical protein
MRKNNGFLAISQRDIFGEYATDFCDPAICRHLNASWIEKLQRQVSMDDNIAVTALLGDDEAFDFAIEIKEYLEKSGYKVVDVVSQALYMKPIKGQIIERKPNDYNQVQIIIGRNAERD